MRKLLLAILLCPLHCLAQPGIITTVAGTGSSGFSGDGGPATAATMGQVMGVYRSIAGDLYIQDADNQRIRRVSPSGIISTFAGGGSSTADGVAATTAHIGFYGNGVITEDPAGNIVFVDNHRVRRVDVTTGTITTIAGMISPGYSGDGGPATAARLNSPIGIVYDAAANLYISDEDNYRIRKVTPSGIISTFAGNGSAGYSGDGGPATAAQFASPDGLCFDAAGNLYVADRYNYRIRKISTSGIINTIAGSGTAGYGGDGGPATASAVRFSEPSALATDGYGNLYVGDFHNGRVRKISPAGIITTVAGGGGSVAEGVPATTASLTDVWAICVDDNNSLFIADRTHRKIRRVGPAGELVAVADSFSVYVAKSCTGPQFTSITNNLTAGRSVVTSFGDGQTQTDAIPDPEEYVSFNHSYAYPGVYTVKQVLRVGGTPIDSATFVYTHVLCNLMRVEFYHDGNSNCVKDGSEVAISTPISFKVDSNGVAIDTIPSLGSVYYEAHGFAGDIFSFSPIDLPMGFSYTCPSSGVSSDTVSSFILTKPARRVGVTCGSSAFDLILASTARTGSHAHVGVVSASNLLCAPTSGTVTLYFNPVYHLHSATPTPTSTTGSSLTWNLGALSAFYGNATNITYHLERSGFMMPGDTVHSKLEITPVTGDADPGNNVVIRIDTSKSSFDPNMIEVSPAGCLPSGISPVRLTYTIHFENMGNDTAHNIFVLDTLADLLDVNTLRMTMSSHPMYVYKTKDGAGRTILKFDFPNIKLLDSSYHGQCQGMFQYTVMTRAGLSLGANIMARAGIYFDDNPVVLTNDANTPIGCPTTVKTVAVAAASEILVYPNPASDKVFIKSDEELIESIEIVNGIGQVMRVMQTGGREAACDIHSLPAGLYNVVIHTAEGRVVRKIAKM